MRRYLFRFLLTCLLWLVWVLFAVGEGLCKLAWILSSGLLVCAMAAEKWAEGKLRDYGDADS